MPEHIDLGLPGDIVELTIRLRTRCRQSSGALAPTMPSMLKLRIALNPAAKNSMFYAAGVAVIAIPSSTGATISGVTGLPRDVVA